jgi:hypothetical protein
MHGQMNVSQMLHSYHISLLSMEISVQESFLTFLALGSLQLVFQAIL